MSISTLFKYVAGIVLSITLLTGCTKIVEVPYYIEASCPKVEVLQPVDKIEGNRTIINDNDVIKVCICDDKLNELLKGASQLRKSENYYIEQITDYNSKFTKPLDK